jgi:hypothetical protein
MRLCHVKAPIVELKCLNNGRSWDSWEAIIAESF